MTRKDSTTPATRADAARIQDGIREILDRLGKHDDKFRSIEKHFKVMDAQFEVVLDHIQAVDETIREEFKKYTEKNDERMTRFEKYATSVLTGHENRLRTIEDEVGLTPAASA